MTVEQAPAPEPACIWCGSALRPKAARCTACKSWQDTRRCSVCREPVPSEAWQCNACKSLQSLLYKDCKVCRARIPEDAGRCNTCTSLQDWRRHLPFSQTVLALLVALLAVLSTALPHILNLFNRHSDTSFVVIASSRQNIALSIANTGRSASVLQRFDLEFGSLPLAPVALRVDPKDREQGNTYVAPGKTTMLRLFADGITRTGGHTKDQIGRLLTSAALVTVTVSIKESGDPGTGPWTEVTQKVPASFVREFVLEAIPDD
jgi:hypothetical protein